MNSYRDASVDPNDKDFLRLFTGSPVLDSSHYQLLYQTAQLSLLWQPENDLCRSLHHAGYTADAISHYRDLFVVQIREEGRVVANPDAEFGRYCRSRSKQLPSSITSDWQPSRDTLQQLSQKNISCAFTLSLVPEFVLYWKDVGRIESDWQSKFCRRVLTYSKTLMKNRTESAQNVH